MANPKVVILCLENRSFDEYFGTFPGAIGFYDPNAGDVFSQPGIMPDGSNLQPFRTSSFSTSSQWSPGMNHSFGPFVQEWNYGAMNGFSAQVAYSVANPTTKPDGSSYPGGTVPGSCVMGYYAANDIAYRWSLAQNFLLCDTYFCSQMGSTAPNRMMLMAGTVIDPSLFNQQQWMLSETYPANDPMLGNPDTQGTAASYPWQSYFGMIGSTGYPDGWAIFDDQYWQPPWLAWTPGVNDSNQPVPYYQGWPSPFFVYGMNMLEYLTDAQQPNAPGLPSGPTSNYYGGQNYYAGANPTALYSTFEMQAASAAGLPGISFILPPSFLTEHPSYAPSDGESYLARIVNAVVSGTDWADPGVVLIITYDEHDGHFDHVNPPTSMSGQPLQGPPVALPITTSTAMTLQPQGPPTTGSWEPWVSATFTGTARPWIGTGFGPLGAALRVPTIIVSPWTWRAGVSSQVAPGAQFDHSSVIQYLEELTNNIKCLPNLPDQPPLNWRRETFSSLSALIPTGNQMVSSAEVLQTLPSVEQADAWRTDLLTRLFGPNPSYPGTFQSPSMWRGPSFILPDPGPDPIQAWPPLQQTCYAVADKTTFGLDEVEAAATAAGDPGGPATFPSAFWVMVDGFDAAELNIGTLPPPGYQPLMPTVTLSLGSGATPPGISPSVGVAQAIGSMPQGIPQRFRFPVDIVFATDGQGNYPAFAGVTLESPTYITVQISFTSHLTWTATTFELELVVAPDPYIQTGTVTYLSTDLRAYMVYTDGSGPDLFGVSYQPSQSPIQFVQNVIANLNSSPAQQAAFAAALPDSDESAVSTVTSLPTYEGKPVASFAIARVTLQGLSQSAYNVRVFFRLCPALSTGTAFNPATLYRSTPLAMSNAPNPSGSLPDTVTSPNPNAPVSGQPSYPWLTKVPLLGINGANAPGTDFVTFPFFAVPRVTPDQAMYAQNPDWPNTQAISPAAGGTGEPVYAFFGCWLDINQANTPQFPASIPTNGQADGPFTSSSPAPTSIAALIRSQHQCLVAEVAYDEITIPLGATPGLSDKLAQRNLTVIGGQ
jgi:phospholipase C